MSNFHDYRWTLMRYLSVQRWATPTQLTVHALDVRTIQKWDLFRSSRARYSVREQFKRIQGNAVYK